MSSQTKKMKKNPKKINGDLKFSSQNSKILFSSHMKSFRMAPMREEVYESEACAVLSL